jgi:uncharacterized protein (TIGR02145 family)
MIKKQTQRVVMLAVCSLFFYAGNAQVKIGDNPTTINPASLLELESTSQGFLPPLMTEMQRDAITTPVNGLIVYCTDCKTTGSLSIYINSTWTCVGTSDAAVSVSVADPGVVSGTYANGVAFTGTNQVSFTITNNSLSTVGPIDFNSAVSITGGTATFSVASAVSASASYSTVSINAGGSTTLTYNVTGTPSSTGTLEFAFSSVGGLSASAAATITQGDATFSLPQVQSFASVNDGATPTYAIITQGVITNGAVFTIPYTGGVGSFTAYTVTVQNVAQESTVGGTRDLTISYALGTFAASGTITMTIGVSDGGTTFSVPTVAPGATDSFATFDFQVNGVSKGNIIFRAVHTGIIPNNATCATATISATPCSTVPGATLNDDAGTTNGTEYNWTGATTSGMANTSTTRALVDIGGQCWMRYDMTNIPTNFNPAPTWVNSTDQGWSGSYSGGPFTNEGRLYQWSAAMNNSTTERAQGVCPTGWHVPSDCEWMYLEDTLGMTTTLQQTNGWRGTQGRDLSTLTLATATNSSGFTALFAGFRGIDGTFYKRGSRGFWWSSSASSATDAYSRYLNNSYAGVNRYSGSKALGFTVRCLKD